MMVGKNLSERSACGALQIARNTQRYEKREDPVNETIREEIRQVARRHRRYGTPRVTWVLRRNGYTVNHKRVERLYALEGLKLPRKRERKKYVPTGWCRPYEATRPNEIWAMDFVFDRTKHGGKMKFLNVIDEGCRECLENRSLYQRNYENGCMIKEFNRCTSSLVALGRMDTSRASTESSGMSA
jgi:putative transposase